MEVPDGLTPKPIVSGDEKIFAFRASDGTPVQFTGAQLFAALLNLKTINDQAITGNGNISVASSETAASIIAKLSVNPSNNASIFPDAVLDPSQFNQPNSLGFIKHDETWLGNFIISTGNTGTWLRDLILSIGASQGWGSGTVPTKLTTPVLTLVSVTASSVEWSWTVIDHATSYILSLFINGNWSNAYAGSLTTFNQTGLAASTNYPYRILARGAGYQDSDNGTSSATTSAPITQLTPPVVVKGAVTSNSYANSWGAVANAGSYEVWRSISGGAYVKIATISELNYNNVGLSGGTYYTYYVKSVPTNTSLYSTSNASNVTTGTTSGSTVVTHYAQGAVALNLNSGISDRTVQETSSGSAQWVTATGQDANIVLPFQFKNTGDAFLVEFTGLANCKGSIRAADEYGFRSGVGLDYTPNTIAVYNGQSLFQYSADQMPVAGDLIGLGYYENQDDDSDANTAMIPCKFVKQSDGSYVPTILTVPAESDPDDDFGLHYVRDHFVSPRISDNTSVMSYPQIIGTTPYTP